MHGEASRKFFLYIDGSSESRLTAETGNRTKFPTEEAERFTDRIQGRNDVFIDYGDLAKSKRLPVF